MRKQDDLQEPLLTQTYCCVSVVVVLLIVKAGPMNVVTVQLDLAKAGISLFIEKPISSRPASEVVDLAQQLHAIQAHNG